MTCTYAELAGMIDHALLHPTLTDDEMRAGCELAARLRVATVCIKPYAVALAAKALAGSGVGVCTVIGFPHGSPATEIKRTEIAAACADGASEVDAVINIGKALSGDWAFVEDELATLATEAHRHGALLKVIFETAFVTDDAAKVRLCQISERAGADFVKTSTGFGYVKGPNGQFTARGATDHDLRLMRANCSERVRVKASGGINDLTGLIRVRELGAARCGTSSTERILAAVNHGKSTPNGF